MLAWFDRAHHERCVLTTLESLPIATVQWAWLPQGCVVVLTQDLPILTAGIIESLCYPSWRQLKILCQRRVKKTRR